MEHSQIGFSAHFNFWENFSKISMKRTQNFPWNVYFSIPYGVFENLKWRIQNGNWNEKIKTLEKLMISRTICSSGSLTNILCKKLQILFEKAKMIHIFLTSSLEKNNVTKMCYLSTFKILLNFHFFNFLYFLGYYN